MKLKGLEWDEVIEDTLYVSCPDDLVEYQIYNIHSTKYYDKTINPKYSLTIILSGFKGQIIKMRTSDDIELLKQKAYKNYITPVKPR